MKDGRLWFLVATGENFFATDEDVFQLHYFVYPARGELLSLHDVVAIRDDDDVHILRAQLLDATAHRTV